jgi:hypothetical protein
MQTAKMKEGGQGKFNSNRKAASCRQIESLALVFTLGEVQAAIEETLEGPFCAM